MIVAVVKRSDGIWASIKVGLTAERLIAAGYVHVSPEISETGELTGLALAVERPSGLPNAPSLSASNNRHSRMRVNLGWDREE